jgi:arylsulfatase A-like enzyme
MWNLRKELKNLILCLIDAARADHLSCYRYSISTTPGIDKIASEGILFENTFSQIPSTLPAVTSLFTSFYAEAHQVLNKHCRLSKEAQTLAKLFKESGFRTAAFSANSYVSRHYGLHNGFLKFEEIFTQMEHT